MDDKRSNKKPSITVRPCDNGDALGPRRRQRSWSVEVDGEVVSDHETRREARDEADARREEARLEADRLLRDADYVSLHVPLTEATRGLIDRAKLRLMKKTACIINAARGGVLVEDDLYDALMAGDIAGAAIDSFQDEPPTGSKLLTTRKVIALPHIGAATDEAIVRTMSYSLNNIWNVLEGKAPLSEVKPV